MALSDIEDIFDLVTYLILTATGGKNKSLAAVAALSFGMMPVNSAMEVVFEGCTSRGKWHQLPNKDLDTPRFFGYIEDDTFHLLEIEDAGSI